MTLVLVISIVFSFTAFILSSLAANDAKKALSAQKENKKLQEALITLVDADGQMRESLPMLQDPTINRTPCGTLCKWSFWMDGDHNWHCGADQGKPVNSARKTFLDSNNQCAMFKFDETANERYLNWGNDKRLKQKKPAQKSIIGQVVQDELEKSLRLPKS